MTSRAAWRCALLAQHRTFSAGHEWVQLAGNALQPHDATAVPARGFCQFTSLCTFTNTSKAHPLLCRGFAASSQLPGASAQGGSAGKGRRLHWTFLLIPAGVAAFLGTWQVGRYRWKVEQVEQRQAGLRAEPVAIMEAAQRLPDYTRVVCAGEMQHGRSILVGPRPRSIMGTTQLGYVLVTPMVDEEWGRAVLVNCGWVPAAWTTDAQLRAGCEPAGKVVVEGVTRASEPRSSFVPDNVPADKRWFWVDVPALAAAAGLPPETPLVEVIRDEPGSGQPRSSSPSSMEILAMRTRGGSSEQQYPITRSADSLLSFSVMPADHRNYALTWFALAGATALLAVRAGRPKGL